MEKGAIFVDSDGFFWPDDMSDDYMRAERDGISFDGEDQPEERLFEQYYLGFRSSIFFVEGKLSDSEFQKISREFREGCAVSALQYTYKHLHSKSTLPVDYMWFLRYIIVNQLKNDYPEVKKIKIKLNMKPRIVAKTIDNNTIGFPALLRTVINQCNFVIINSVYETVDSEKNLSEKLYSGNVSQQSFSGIDRSLIARGVLPYLAFCHDDFSVQNLPIVGAYSEDAIMTTFQFINLQMLFILAHEYAHILLGHYNKRVSVTGSSIEMECEADRFALDVLMKYIKMDDTYSYTDVFTSIRWLFKFQLIEEYVGSLIRNDNMNFYESAYEERRSRFQSELIHKYEVRKTSLLDQVGFVAIAKLQSVLFENGTTVVNRMINAINKSTITGGVEPWWEIIPNK